MPFYIKTHIYNVKVLKLELKHNSTSTMLIFFYIVCEIAITEGMKWKI